MFYIIEQLKGTPKNVQGVRLGHCDLYNYYVCGCETPEVEDYHVKSNSWGAHNQKFGPIDFINQIQEIIKRKGFSYNRQMSF